MPNFKTYNYSQSAMAVIDFEEQLQSGTFEFTLHKLIDNHIDLSVFHGKHSNDSGGRSAYDPAILLKIILYAYAKGITSSREIQWQCEHNIIFKALYCDTAPHFTVKNKGDVMGLFNRVKSIYKKNEAIIVVQTLLEHQAKAGIFDLDPKKFAIKIIEIIWNSAPDIYNGKFGQHPHKLAVAASALSKGISLFEGTSSNRSAVIQSIGNILSEVERNGRLYPLSSLDHQLLEASMLIFVEADQEFSETSLAGQIDSRSHDVLSRAAAILEIQLMLCKANDRKYEDFLHGKFARGYMVGFFDAAIQRANIAVDSEDQFFLLIIEGHTYIFDGNIEHATNYTFDSLALKGDQEFDSAQWKGGAEYFDFLDGKIRNPIGLMACFHENRSVDA